MSRRRQKNKEFSMSTKIEAKRRANYQCQECGATEPLQAHHLIPIYIAREIELPNVAIRNLANCEILCDDCHKETHENELSIEEYKALAQSLLGVSALF